MTARPGELDYALPQEPARPRSVSVLHRLKGRKPGRSINLR